ncbi:hypothetical protein VN97_g11848, partial [Penicillium thymicola]
MNRARRKLSQAT